jgi:poly(A) polymerase
MTQSGLLELLFPSLTAFLKGPNGESIYKLLKAADAVNTTSGKKILDRSVLTSCLLFPIIEREIHSLYLKEHVIPHFGQVMVLTSSLIKGIFTSSFSHFPRRISTTMHFLITTQFRLTPLTGKRQVRPRLFQNKEFNLALHFLKIRAIVDEGLMDPYSWWTHHYRQSEKQIDRRGHHPHPPPHHRPAAKDHSQAS